MRSWKNWQSSPPGPYDDLRAVRERALLIAVDLAKETKGRSWTTFEQAEKYTRFIMEGRKP